MALIVSISAFFLSLGLTGASAWYARRRGLLAIPDERSSHDAAVPSGGGLGIILSWVPTTYLLLADSAPLPWQLGVLPACLVLALVGWLDDNRPLSARFRLFVQLAVSLYLLACCWQLELVDSVPLAALSVLWLLWIANLYNFMDGSHGMAGSQGVISGAVLAWLFYRYGANSLMLVSLLVSASCLGFLPWNLGVARVFMGDVGSLVLGLTIGTLTLQGVLTGAFSLPVGLLIMAVFLVDATITLLIRVIRGERWYNAHRQHLYQRLIARGWSHGRVVVFYQAVNLVLVLPGIGVAVRYPEMDWPVALLLVSFLAFGWYRLSRKLGVLAQAG